MHWTYNPLEPGSHLEQGDILEPTAELSSLFAEVHRYFCDPKYLAFIVITQSCDLVRRKGRCKTPHINLAVVRPLGQVLFSLLDAVCESIAPGVYLQETKGKANQLLSRIFNQNEWALGLFYLYPDPDIAGIAEHAVAQLRVSISLQAQHYELLQRARRGRLTPEFQNKLGWLVGNLYSRIGTPDWTDSPDREKLLAKMLKETLSGTDPNAGPVWVKKYLVEAASQQGVDVPAVPKDELPKVLEQHKPPDPREDAIREVRRIVTELLPVLDEHGVTKIGQRLSNSEAFKTAFRRAKIE